MASGPGLPILGRYAWAACRDLHMLSAHCPMPKTLSETSITRPQETLMDHATQALYRSHLLRMWVEHPTERRAVWRFSLEEVASGRRWGFADLDALVSYLLADMEAGMAEQASAVGDSDERNPDDLGAVRATDVYACDSD